MASTPTTQDVASEDNDRLVVNLRRGDKLRIQKEAEKRGIYAVSDFVRSIIFKELETGA